MVAYVFKKRISDKISNSKLDVYKKLLSKRCAGSSPAVIFGSYGGTGRHDGQTTKMRFVFQHGERRKCYLD